MTLPTNPEHWPVAARDDYHERAAIREHDGGAAPEDARRAAEAEVRRAWDEPTLFDVEER